jgi:hypothetical protein
LSPPIALKARAHEFLHKFHRIRRMVGIRMGSRKECVDEKN